MKKSILCIIFACCNILLIHAEEKQYLGVHLGYTQPITRLNAAIEGKETTLNATVYNGLKVGVVYDATIVKGFGYTIGLNYTFGANNTSWKQVGKHPYPRQKTQSQYHQLEIPVDWQYKFEIAQNTWLMLYTGPTLQCGLSLTENTEKQEEPKGEIKSTPTNRYEELSRLNVTWGLGAGFQYERYFLRGGYDFGIINPYKEDLFEGKDIYTRGRFDQWQIKLGIYLWEK